MPFFIYVCQPAGRSQETNVNDSDTRANLKGQCDSYILSGGDSSMDIKSTDFNYKNWPQKINIYR